MASGAWDGSRVVGYIDGDYRTWTGDNLAIMVTIETVEAVENCEAILNGNILIGIP